MASNVESTSKSEFLRTSALYERQHPLGQQLVYPNDAVIKGSDIGSLDPQDLLISIPDVLRDRDWDYSSIREFGLKGTRVTTLLTHGQVSSHYVGFADVLRVEATPEWKTLKAERAARRVQQEEESVRFRATIAAHYLDLETVSEPTTSANRSAKAAALRNIVAHVKDRTTIAGWDVTKFLDLKPKQLTALVAAGTLSRKRSVGWDYNAELVRKYALHLAEQLEQEG